MSTTLPGGDQKPEPTPRQALFLRFDSETPTVDVTSTTPLSTKDLPNDSQNEPVTVSKAKEQHDKVSKWINEQSLLNKTDSRKSAEGSNIKLKNDDRTTLKVNEEKITSLPSEKSPKPVPNFEPNLEKSNIYKPDSAFGGNATFGGRRLSLAQRDKVVGGAAMVFADPLISREGTGTKPARRTSEYDVGRLSSASVLRSENRRSTEPKIDEDTISNFRQSNDNKNSFKTELKGNSLFLRCENKSESDKNKNLSGFHQAADKVTFKTDPNGVPQGDSSFARCDKSESDKNKIQSNLSDFHQAADKVPFKTDPKGIPQGDSSFARCDKSESDKNKIQSNLSDFHQAADKVSFKTDPKGIPQGDSSFTRCDNKSERDKNKIQSNVSDFHQATDKVTFKTDSKGVPQGDGSFARCDKSECDKNKIQSNLSGFHQAADKVTSKMEPTSVSQGNRSFSRCDKSESDKNKIQSNLSGFHQAVDKVTSKIEPKSVSQGNRSFSCCDKSESDKNKIQSNLSGFHQAVDKVTSKIEPKSVSQGNSSFSRCDKSKSDKNKIQSNLSGFHQAADKVTSKTEPKSVSQGKTSFSRCDKSQTDNDKIQFISNADENNVLSCSETIRQTEPKIEENKFQSTSNAPKKTANNEGTYKTENNSFKCGENSALIEPKRERDKMLPTSSGSVYPQPKHKIPLHGYFKSSLQGENLSSDDNTKNKEYHKTPSNTESSHSTTKTPTDKAAINQTTDKVTHQKSYENASYENTIGIKSQASSMEKTKPNQDKLQSSQVPTTNDSVQKSSSGTSNYLDLLRRPTSLPDVVPGKALSKSDKDEKSSKTARSSEATVNKKQNNECVSTLSKPQDTTIQKTASSEKNRSKSVVNSPVATFAQVRSTPKVTTVVHSRASVPTASKLKSTGQDQHPSGHKLSSETEFNQSVGSSSKREPQASGAEPLAVRPVTRSKSDVGEGNKGRSATTPARKSCAERRCCGARPRPSQEATPVRARSLSRVPPMGSSASLTSKNKTSWTTQRALEAEVKQLKRELQMHQAEELRLHREIHKLRSVLQQATSFGEETAGAAGDTADGALLVSLQDRHGMAGATGVTGGASKKQGVSGESCEPESIEVPRHEKDLRSRQLIKAAILDNDFLKNLARCQIRELVDCMYPQRVHAGSYVIREGESGSHLYVLAEGEMEVLKEGTVLGTMGPGKAFGELAILYNCTRTASIRAVSDLQVWVLDRRAFQQIMMRTGMQRLEDNIAFLRSVPLLRGINEQTLSRIADALEPEFYPAGEYIVRQGARGNTFFIISGGLVEVTQRGPQGDDVVLRTLERGEYFGEQALLHDDCRTASVRALPPGVDCLTLDRESFNALIGSLSELHHKDYAEDTKSQTSRISFTNDCRKDDEDVGSLRLEDLQPLGTLGIGGFGCVRLVMAPNGRSYALKCLSKRHVAVTGQQEHVAAERDVLLAARSPFIVRLLRTFRDEANVYLLLEACLGGEVWALLRDHERLTDKAARFVAACVLEALEYLHARSIVYRDLKPENLVMDANGYVKLVDFGFCKRLPGGCKTWTFCGTPEYVAPEVILNRGHDRAVDYWALGVLIYELLTGAPPFAASDPMGTYKLILLGMESAVMPKYISRPACDLIRRLCRAAPSERIGYQRAGFREVKAHRWFQDLDWDALKTQTMTPPIQPQVSGPADMSNFYPQPLDEELAPAELSNWDADF